MFFRATVLSIALVLGAGATISFLTETAAAGPKSTATKTRKIRKYSKAWWRWYKAKQRKRKAFLARKKALRARQILYARQKAKQLPTIPNSQILQTTEQIESPKIEMQYPVNDDAGKSLGVISLSVVGRVSGTDGEKKIGGVPTSSLRRTVLEKMVKEDGWVTNDYYKTINGNRVYVVVAQTSAKGAIKMRTFYFTEADGKIYSVSTSCLHSSQDIVVQESEKMIVSLQLGNNKLVGLK